MEYKEVNEARDLPGLRLALTAGVPGPWSESAKFIFDVKGIDYVPVRQAGGQQNDELVAWTGHRNAPVAVFEDMPPKAQWADILALAERIKPEPSLVPEDFDDRILMFGLANEICGEGGLGWNRRLMMFDPAAGKVPSSAGGFFNKTYGYTKDYAAEAAGKVVYLMNRLTAQLKEQKSKGSDYFIGGKLTALDVYWAAFSQLIEPMPADLNPIPDAMRGLYNTDHPWIVQAKDPLLFDHRMMIYEKHLTLPLDF